MKISRRGSPCRKAAKPMPLVVESGGKLEDVLPFQKREIQRQKVSSLDLAYHGRLTTGHIRVVMSSGEVYELAKIDGDVGRKAFGELVELVNSLYPEIKKSVA